MKCSPAYILAAILTSCFLYHAFAIEEAEVKPIAEKVAEDPFCGEILGVNQYADLSEQEALVKSAAEQGNAVKFMQDYRGDGGSGAALLKKSLKYASTSQMARYGQSLALFAAPGIVFGVIMSLWWLCFSSCRMCGRCFKPKKAQDEYSRKEKLCPVFTYIFVGLLGAACSIIGVVYLMEVMNTVTGAICDVDFMRLESAEFFNGMTGPLNKIDSLFMTASTGIKSTMQKSGSIDGGLKNMTASLKSYGKKVKAINIPGAPCLFCNAMGDQSVIAANEMDDQAEKPIQDLIDLGKSIDRKVVAAQNETMKITKKSVEINNLAISFLDANLKSMTNSAKVLLGPIKDNFSTAGLAFFAITLVAVLFTLIGLFFLNCGKYTNCTGIKAIDDLDDVAGAWLIFLGWWLTSIAVIAMLFIGGFLLPFSVATSDTCIVIDDFAVNMKEYMEKLVPGEDKPNPLRKPEPGLNFADALQGCYNNQSLFNVLNMSESFNFDSSIDFNKANSYNEAEAFDFKEFDKMRKSTFALTPKNFSFDESAIATEGNATKKQEMETINQTIYDTIGWMKKDVSQINTYKSTFQASVKTYSDDLKGIEPMLAPVNGQARLLRSRSFCGFVKTHFETITSRLCTQALPSMLNVALACLLNAFFGVFMIYNGLLVNTRFGGHGKTVDDQAKNAADGYSIDESRVTPREGDLEEGEDDIPPPPPEEMEEGENEGEEQKEETPPGPTATEEYVNIGSPGADRGWNEEEYVVYDDEEDELHYMEEADHEAETGLI